MKIGFKTGLKNWADGQRIVEEHSGSMCEIWYNIHLPEQYQEMISWLEERNVTVGLHHWGVAQGKYKTNLSTPHFDIRSETIQQIKDTIDRASELQKPAYVNAHPGAYMVETVDLQTGKQQPEDGTEVSAEVAQQLFLESCDELFSYATSKGVVLTIETLPAGEQYADGDRNNFYVPTNIPLFVMKTMTEQGGTIANDITHTAGQLALSNPDPQYLWDQLMMFTRSVELKTKLLHVNTVVPPYNGTDSHSGITDENFTHECFPSKEQLKALLSLFTHREDVYVVAEPEIDRTIENFLALQQIISEIPT